MERLRVLMVRVPDHVIHLELDAVGNWKLEHPSRPDASVDPKVIVRPAWVTHIGTSLEQVLTLAESWLFHYEAGDL